MPGMLFHFVFSNYVYDEVLSKIKDKDKFFLGSIMPDYCINKDKSHYREKESFSGFEVPNLNKAKKDLLDCNDSYLLGIYSHIFLDYYFIKEIISKKYTLNADQGIVLEKNTNKTYDISKFYARPYEGGILYRGYSELNHLFISNNLIKVDYLLSLPNDFIMPNNINFYGLKKANWKEELKWYLSGESKYTGYPFEFKEVANELISLKNLFIYELEF